MDHFIDHPNARAKSTVCVATDNTMWRVDHLLGRKPTLQNIVGPFLDEEWCNECLHAPNCDSRRRYEVLERSPSHRVVYTRREELARCHSIPYLAVDHIGDGVLFDAERQENEYMWRILMPDTAKPGQLYDTIQSRLRDGLTLELEHLSEHDRTVWHQLPPAVAELPQTQRETITAAVEHGYYATPRQTTLQALSDELGVPRSTLQYRLQVAEGRIVEQFVGNGS